MRIITTEEVFPAEAALECLNISIDVTRLPSTYSIATQQMVAIVRVLDLSSKILIRTQAR